MALHPSTVIERSGDEVRLFARRTGRWVVIGAETLERLDRLPPVQQRLHRLGLLDDTRDDELLDWVVCRHQATHLLPEVPALWGPVPEAHGSGGHAYVERPVDAVALAVYRAINDRRTARQLAEAAGATVEQVWAVLQRFTAADVQAAQLRPTTPRSDDPGLRRLMGAQRAAHARTDDQTDDRGATTLATYHLDAIVDGRTHFDDRETTVAHALALPHPGLRGRPYGQALREALGWHGPVVEVGCGTGELAAAWLAAGSVPYLRIDLSPELLATQARTAPGSTGVLADATQLPLADRSVPFLLSNEVLADLAAVPLANADAAVADRIARLGLRPRGWANVGSWDFVEEVARVLAPGGLAVLTEFGSPDGSAEEAVQLDHPEVSIRFDDLVAVAVHAGLEAELVRLDELLDADLRAPQLARVSWMALRARARSVGVHLPARAWTRDNLALPFAMEGLQFDTLADEGPGPLITRFWALRLRRRRAG